MVVEPAASISRLMVPPEGFEPSTSRSGGARSYPLSYEGTDADCSTLLILRALASNMHQSRAAGCTTCVAQALAIPVASAG